MSRFKPVFLVVLLVLILIVLWLLIGKNKTHIEHDAEPTRLGLIHTHPAIAEKVSYAFSDMGGTVRSVYPEGAKSSIYETAPAFDAAAWLNAYAEASLAGDLPRLSNLHANLQQAALVLSQRDLLTLSATLVTAATRAGGTIESEKVAHRQFAGYIFMAFIPIFDHIKRVDQMLQEYLLAHRHLVGDIPSLFLRRGSRVVYFPLRGEDCPLCPHNPKLTVDSLIGLSSSSAGGIAIPLLGNRDCSFSEMMKIGYNPELGPTCQRSQCMPSNDPDLNPAVMRKKDPHPFSSQFGGGDGENCAEADSGDEEGCGLDLPAASGKDKFFACNFGAIAGLKNSRWNYMNTGGALPCSGDPHTEGEGEETPPDSPSCEDGEEDCEDDDSNSESNVWDQDGDGAVDDQDINDTINAAWQEGLEIWRDPEFQKRACALVCERYGITWEEFSQAIAKFFELVDQGEVDYDWGDEQRSEDEDTDYAETIKTDFDSDTGTFSFVVQFYINNMRKSEFDPAEVAAHEQGHIIFDLALLSGPLGELLIESNEDDSPLLYEFQEWALGALGFPTPYPFSYDRDRQCAPDDINCGNSCSALANAINEIGSCLQAAFDQREDLGLGPWIQPVGPEVAMGDECFTRGTTTDQQCAATRCAEGSPAGVCSFGTGCCCNSTHVDSGMLPDGPLPGCPDGGIDPYQMCLPEM